MWSIIRRVVVLPVLVGCSGPAAEAPDRFERLFSGDATVLDLTHALSASMPYWPNPDGNPFRHDTLMAHPDGSPRMAAYATPEHHGTHLDAPIHTGEGQPSVDELTAHDLFGPAAVVDIRRQVAGDPDYLLTRQDLLDWEADHGQIPVGAVVLLLTGWSDRWGQPDAYAGMGDDGNLHFPGFGEDAAHFLIGQRTVRGIGIDDPSVDHGPSTDFPVHGIVNGAGKFHLENVTNLDRLPAIGAHLIIAPIKIEGGSGGQVRVFAVLP